jgi:hypothetical protein
MTELEQASDAFDEVASLLIRHARSRSGGRVGRDLHVDGTEAETNARLIHDCTREDDCERSTVYGIRIHTDEARRARQRANRQDGGDQEEEAFYLATAEIEEIDPEVPYKRFKVGGCWYRSRDKSAGIRAYVHNGNVNRFWHGFYNMKVVDHFTGAPVSVRVVNASDQESKTYPELLSSAIKAVGEKPRSVVADRGLSVTDVFELNTREGIASVMPFRKNVAGSRRVDEDSFDRHGVPRCKKCGAVTEFVRFAAEPSPRIWFRCVDLSTPDCRRHQSIACSRNWKQLLPLWRTSEAYFALKTSHSNYERVHSHWRTRYRVGATTHEMRPKRIGLSCQQLRASAALVVEWLRVLVRQGWIGSARRNFKRIKQQIGGQAFSIFTRSRLRSGLLAPYGTKAVELHLGPARPAAPPGPDDPPGTDPDDEPQT